MRAHSTPEVLDELQRIRLRSHALLLRPIYDVGPEMKRVPNADILYKLGVRIQSLQQQLDSYTRDFVAEQPDSSQVLDALLRNGVEATAYVLLDLEGFAPLPDLTAAVRDLQQWFLNLRGSHDRQTVNDVLQAIDSALRDIGGVVYREVPKLELYFIPDLGDFTAARMLERGPNLASEHAGVLPLAARTDIREAGKCLMLGLPTAVGFHLFRAMEAVIALYFPIFGVTPKESQRNWGAYMKILRDHDVDPGVTEFVDHIREQYRNPITHPEVVLTSQEAQDLMGVAMSAIRMMLADILERRAARTNTSQGKAD